MKVAEQNGTVFAEPGVPAGGKMKKKKKKKIKKLRTVKCEHSFNILLLLKKLGNKTKYVKSLFILYKFCVVLHGVCRRSYIMSTYDVKYI